MVLLILCCMDSSSRFTSTELLLSASTFFGEAMNQDQRELLELAAYAVGLDANLEFDGTYSLWKDLDCIASIWNPLTNKADAFDLIVKLGLDVRDFEGQAWVYRGSGPGFLVPYNDNQEAATMLAITRAAAEIGKQKKENRE